MLESDEGLHVMKKIIEIYQIHATNTSQPENTIVSQGESHIPPPSTVASIPTYTTPQVTTTMQQVSQVTPLALPTRIPSFFVESNVASSTTFTPISVPFTYPNTTYTPSPLSLPPHPTYTEPLITQLFQIVSSIQQQIYTINQNQAIPPTYYVHSSPLSSEILRKLMPQGIEMPRLEKYEGKEDPTNHVNAYTTLCSDFILDNKLLAKPFPRILKDITLEWFSNLPNHSI